jgi:hypothetical protein
MERGGEDLRRVCFHARGVRSVGKMCGFLWLVELLSALPRTLSGLKIYLQFAKRQDESLRCYVIENGSVNFLFQQTVLINSQRRLNKNIDMVKKPPKATVNPTSVSEYFVEMAVVSELDCVVSEFASFGRD